MSQVHVVEGLLAIVWNLLVMRVCNSVDHSLLSIDIVTCSVIDIQSPIEDSKLELSAQYSEQKIYRTTSGMS